MAYNVTKVGYIDADHCSTEPVPKERLEHDQKEIGDIPLFALWMEHNGPNGDGVQFQVRYNHELCDDKPVCEFYIPDKSWETFVEAVKCLDQMWRQHG